MTPDAWTQVFRWGGFAATTATAALAWWVVATRKGHALVHRAAVIAGWVATFAAATRLWFIAVGPNLGRGTIGFTVGVNLNIVVIVFLCATVARFLLSMVDYTNRGLPSWEPDPVQPSWRGRFAAVARWFNRRWRGAR